MKRCVLLMLLMLTLCGCAAEEVLETVSDELVLSAMAQPREITVNLPDNAVSPVLESDSRQMYLSEDYEILLETLSGGDVDATIRSLTGYEKDKLIVMQTQWDGVERYEFVWVAAGETGDRLGRGVILDDGNYHYCMSVLRDAENQKMSQIVWRDVFASFHLV